MVDGRPRQSVWISQRKRMLLKKLPDSFPVPFGVPVKRPRRSTCPALRAERGTSQPAAEMLVCAVSEASDAREDLRRIRFPGLRRESRKSARAFGSSQQLFSVRRDVS